MRRSSDARFDHDAAQERTDARTMRLPPYSEILHNDDVNTMIYVASVLYKVLGYTVEKCVQLMLESHNSNRAVVWTIAMGLTEMKTD